MINKLPKNTSLLCLGIFLFSLLIAWFLVISRFPYMGFAIFFASLSTGVYFWKQPRTRIDQVLYAFCLMLSACLVIRSNEELTFYNIIGILYLGSILATNKLNQFSLVKLLTAPVGALISTLSANNVITWDTGALKRPFISIASFNITKILVSVAITFGLLIVIIPLLGSANPLFADMIENIFKSLNLGAFFEYIFGKNLGLHIGRLVIAFILFSFSSKMISYASKEEEEKTSETHAKEVTSHSDVLFLPKIAISLVLVLFFITQFQLYFADEAMLKALNYTNSRQTREVFGQLSIVSLIIFALVFKDKGRNSLAKYSTYFLVLEGIFLTGIALKSVYDYSSTWGFTYKRLYGFTVIFWLLCAYALFTVKYLKHITDSEFLKRIVVLTGATLLLVNFANFDHLIYYKNQSVTHAGLDYQYLARLSSDSYSYHLQFDSLSKNMDKREQLYAMQDLMWKIESLQMRYKEFDIRNFNFSEYNQYLAIKDIDVKEYRKKVDDGYKRLDTYNPYAPIVTVTPTATTSNSPTRFSSLSSYLTNQQSVFYFTPSRTSNYYIVEVSTVSDMSTDVYLNFATGSTSPINIIPPNWDKYTCGRTLYWRVKNPSGDTSAIKQAMVQCD